MGYNGQQEAFDEVYTNNGDWDDVNLTAYVVGNAQYQVCVSAKYVTYATPHYWRIDVEIRLDD